MKTNTKMLLDIMQVVCWILFIGLCIQAGTLLVSLLFTYFGNTRIAEQFAKDLYLPKLYHYSPFYYIALCSLLLAIALLKAHIFYLVIQFFSRVNMDHPFSHPVSNLISKVVQTAFGIGIIAVIGNVYNQALMKKNIPATSLSWQSSEFLFLAGILFVISLIFKRGVALQSENDLTI
ncbi:hypothetical protein A8C56_18065 [Niabella ginsenosidivorans]|uniref:DUF2975 domain-containing protein n=1 Tax=Niabella ginsenosidivorans TaxID=1176587 RepID=A0A1A9I5L7_9BACT|nr:DUF2975 domain-containing protein [Niabella ginsenosidivorans]ANH82625.1 hypothetical protein A8C56_18065 [Niabella ginsenosidivorans]